MYFYKKNYFCLMVLIFTYDSILLLFVFSESFQLILVSLRKKRKVKTTYSALQTFFGRDIQPWVAFLSKLYWHIALRFDHRRLQ